jgi:hypothetical protein
MNSLREQSTAQLRHQNNDVAPIVCNGRLPALGDGFARFVAAPGISQRIAENVKKEILEGKVGPYDTHPPLRERIAAAERVDAATRASASTQNDNQPPAACSTTGKRQNWVLFIN